VIVVSQFISTNYSLSNIEILRNIVWHLIAIVTLGFIVWCLIKGAIKIDEIEEKEKRIRLKETFKEAFEELNAPTITRRISQRALRKR